MVYRPLKNYLRTARLRSGFTQDEIAMLLGAASGAKVSRYETFTRLPSVATVFAYEIVFGSTASYLFAGSYAEVRRLVMRRARRLAKKVALEFKDGASLRKLKFLQAIVEGQGHGQQSTT